MMLGWFADPRNSRPARRLEQTWAVAAVAAWLIVGDAGLVGWAQYPPGGWPPPGGGGGGVPPCNPSCTLEIVSPAEGDIVSGVVTIDSVLHITSGPPAQCPTGVTGLSLTFTNNPSNWDPNDWWVLDWVAGTVVPVPRAFDSTQWCSPPPGGDPDGGLRAVPGPALLRAGGQLLGRTRPGEFHHLQRGPLL